MTNLYEIGKNKYNTDSYAVIVCNLIDDFLSNNSLFSLNEIVETHDLLKRLIADNINFPLAISNFENWVFLFNSKINNFVDEYLRDLIEYKYSYVTPDKIGARENVHTETEVKNGEYKTDETATNNGTHNTTTEVETTGNATTYNSDYPNQNISKENILAYASNSAYTDSETTSGSTINGTDETTTTNSGTRNEDISTTRNRTETFNDLTPLQVYNELLVKMQTIYPIFKAEMEILWIREI